MEFFVICILRLTCVRAQPQASIYVTRVCIVFHATAYASFFRAQVCKSRLASILPSLTVLAGSITSWSIGFVGKCLICLVIGCALQPARVPTRGPNTRRHTSTRAMYLLLRAVYLWRTRRLSKSVGRDSQRRQCLPLQLHCRLSECVRALCTALNWEPLARFS